MPSDTIYVDPNAIEWPSFEDPDGASAVDEDFPFVEDPAAEGISEPAAPPPAGPIEDTEESAPEILRHNVVDLTQRTIYIKIKRGRLGISRKVSDEQYQISADKDMISVSKHILDSKEYQAIAKLDGYVTRWLKRICLPFDTSLHLIPIAALAKVNKFLKEKAAERDTLIDKFIAAYPTLQQNAQVKLGALYNPTEYPPVGDLKGYFKFFWQYVSFGLPDQLAEVSKEIFEEEREKAAQQMAEASAEIQMVLRESMLKLVQHMANALAPDPETGKRKRFTSTTLSNLTEFMENFNIRNVTDDQELQRLVDQAREMLKGSDIEALKQQDVVRERVQQGMSKIAETLDGMVVRSGRRRIRFEDQEPGE